MQTVPILPGSTSGSAVSKTLTLPQVFQLVEASKETPIHMQILFAVLMGLRRGEIKPKTPSSIREIPIPDYVFEAILEQHRIYEKNRR